MNRKELGLRLQQWHASQNDPIYAVGSFYHDDKRYPDKSIVEDALHNLKRELEKTQQRLEVSALDAKYFEESIRDLSEIIRELTRFIAEDYQ